MEQCSTIHASLFHTSKLFNIFSCLNFLQCTLRIDKDEFDFLGGCDGLDGVMMMLGAVGCVSFMAVPYPAEMMDKMCIRDR